MVREKQTLDFALEYRDKFNLSIIPANPKNKKTLVRWKQHQEKRATAARIRAWFSQYPDAMVGIVTGALSGLFVIDCDTEEGYAAIRELIPEGLKMPIARTPRGWHLYFQYPADCTLTVGQNVIPGVDFRGEGGYVVSPPSVNSSGGCYEWTEGQSLSEVTPPTMPKVIIDLLGECKKPPSHEKKLLEKERVERPGFAMITNEVICSDAYKVLTNASRTAYTLLRAQIKKKTQVKVVYPYSCAVAYMERRTFTKSIRQLIDVGFIRKEQFGGLYRRTNTYEFINQWQGYKKS